MERLRNWFLLFYMMRVPLLFLFVLGVVLPGAFGTPMFHGLADLTLKQVFLVSLVASLLVSSAITASFLVLLYGRERADGWLQKLPPGQRVSAPWVIALYVYGSICWLNFLRSIYDFMEQAGRVNSDLLPGFLVWAGLGWAAGVLVIVFAFVVALLAGKPDDDEAMEVFAFPAILVIRRLTENGWIDWIKQGRTKFSFVQKLSRPEGPRIWPLSRLGPGYRRNPGGPLHTGHRFAAIVTAAFLLIYWLCGQKTYWDLKTTCPWSASGAPNDVLFYLLMFLIFWNCLLSGLTFFVDRYRIPALAALGAVLFVIANFGSSDHVFFTVERRPGPAPLEKPSDRMNRMNGPLVVVAAAGGGIQSAAWTSEVLCGLRTDLRQLDFQGSVLAISGVSGGSVGALFYLRCLEADQEKDPPEVRARYSSLGAVAWGLTHPDLRHIFLPAITTTGMGADRGWALERSIVKSAQFSNSWEHLYDGHPEWPVILFNSTDASTGDPVVFTNSLFPNADGTVSTGKHSLHGFLQQRETQDRDVLVATAARISAAFPYVSPEARPAGVSNGDHLGDGGYFDNSGMFTLSEWLKDAAIRPDTAATEAKAEPKHRILILQLDAFPDDVPSGQQTAHSWLYQLYSPLATMLNVRSEGQVVRDEAAGKDLQKLLNAAGYETGWMLIRYEPQVVTSAHGGTKCPSDPPLSWHLTPVEQQCIVLGWSDIKRKAEADLSDFLEHKRTFVDGQCDSSSSDPDHGVLERFCPAASVAKHP